MLISSGGQSIALEYATSRAWLEHLGTQIPETCENETELDEEKQLWQHEIERLELWAAEHEIDKGKLDHTLKEESPLKEQVIDLLQSLQHVEVVSGPSLEGEVISSTQSNPGVADVTFSTIIIGAQEDEVHSSTTSLSFDNDVSITTSEPATVARQILDRAHTYIAHLLQLSPSLRSIIHHTTLQPIRDPVAAGPDLEYVTTRLPRADRALRENLGFANWTRRHRLIDLREKYTAAKVPMQSRARSQSLRKEMEELRTARLDQAIVKPPTLPQIPDRPGTPQSIAITMVTESATTKTTSDSIFTKATSHSSFTRSTASSSVNTNFKEDLEPLIEDCNMPSIDSLPAAPKLRIPDPPSPNHKFSGARFLCPYCFSWIEGLTSAEDWCNHVFLDLRPYMCTYTNCDRPDTTYTDKTSWWDHEYAEHRVQRVWDCAPCHEQDRVSTFNSLNAFLEHAKIHTNMDARQVRRVAKVCERQTSIAETRRQCPLCHMNIPCPEADSDAIVDGDDLSQDWEDAICNHVANHLEQLALFVALPTGNIDNEPDILIDDSDSEFDEKDEIQSVLDVQSLISDRRMPSKQEVRAANVERFFDDQAAFRDPFNMPPTETQRTRMPRAIDSSNHAIHLQQSRSPKSSLASVAKNLQWPVITNLRPRNEFYTGNDSLLEEMKTVFEKRGSILVLSGLGGVGKTQAAVEFCHRYRDEFECIFWLQADTDAGLAQSFIEITVQLGIDVRGETHLQDVQRGRNWLTQTEHRWLIVIDNAYSWDEISQYIPHQFSRSNGSVLITSQNDRIATASRSSRLRKLSPLEPKDGANLLFQYMKNKDPEEEERAYAEEISSFVGGLPVAIAHVAAYADHSQFDLEEVIEVFREWRRVARVAIDEADDLPASFRQASFVYDDVLRMVYNITLRALNQDAQDLANILAYLNSEAVPEKMIWRVHENQNLEFLDVREKLRMKTTKKQLTQRRLVQLRDINGESCLSMHRALQRSIRESLTDRPHKQQKVFDQAVTLVHESFPTLSPTQQPGAKHWDELQRLLPHIASLREVYKTRRAKIQGTVDLVHILSRAGIDQWERGATRDGLESLRTAEMALDSAGCGLDDSLRADIHIAIALMHDNAGLVNRQEALDRRLQALRVRRAGRISTRDDEVLLHNALMDLAISHLQCHEYKEAEVIIEQCFTKYQEWGTPDQIPYEYAKYFDNMSLVRLYQRRYDDAIDLARQALDWTGKVSSVALENRQVFTLACIYLQSGQVKEARQLHQSVHDARVDHFGPSGELTLHSKHALGAIAELEGQYEEAESWFNEILSLCHSALWQVEAVNRTKYHLAQVQKALGKLTEAEKLEQESTKFLHSLLRDNEGVDIRLKPDSSDEIMFDHIITVSARFTSVGLVDSVVS